MAPLPSTDVTELLLDWRGGNVDALDQLVPLVYDELRKLAYAGMRGESATSTLQPTALVNEAYLRLVEMDIPWQDRVHFFAVAGSLMRRIVVDEARRRRAKKRGGDQRPLSLDDVDIADQPVQDLLALDQAMGQLAAFDERKSKVVELRFFAGLTLSETAEVMGISKATVERDLKMAKAWLSAELRRGPSDDP